MSRRTKTMTALQREVLRLSDLGMCTRQIALQLGRSHQAVNRLRSDAMYHAGRDTGASRRENMRRSSDEAIRRTIRMSRKPSPGSWP